MAHSLNLTLKVKQDPETLAKLEQFKEIFPQMSLRPKPTTRTACAVLSRHIFASPIPEISSSAES